MGQFREGQPTKDDVYACELMAAIQQLADRLLELPLNHIRVVEALASLSVDPKIIKLCLELRVAHDAVRPRKASLDPGVGPIDLAGIEMAHRNGRHGLRVPFQDDEVLDFGPTPKKRNPDSKGLKADPVIIDDPLGPNSHQ